jgi:hypothetical protein
MDFKLLICAIDSFDNYFSIDQHAKEWGVTWEDSKISFQSAR